MPRYGNRGIGDFIPRRGEARALVEVKGSVGAKGSRMRSRRGRFNAMRQGRSPRKPQTWIPLFKGVQTALSNRQEQVWARYATPGSTDEGIPDMAWLWVISPELVGVDHSPTVVALGGEADPDMQYTVAGMTGRLTWTPMESLGDPNTDSAAWSGFVRLYWVKVKSIPQQAGSQLAQYPWDGSWTDPVDSGPSHVFSYLPYYNTASVSNAAEQRSFALRDARYRRDIIRRTEKAWVLPYMPTTYFDPRDELVHTEYFVQAARPITLPLPRKLVCKVGRGEALACAYQVVSQSGLNAGSAPTGVFDASDVRIKVYAHI